MAYYPDTLNGLEAIAKDRRMKILVMSEVPHIHHFELKTADPRIVWLVPLKDEGLDSVWALKAAELADIVICCFRLRDSGDEVTDTTRDYASKALVYFDRCSSEKVIQFCQNHLIRYFHESASLKSVLREKLLPSTDTLVVEDIALDDDPQINTIDNRDSHTTLSKILLTIVVMGATATALFLMSL